MSDPWRIVTEEQIDELLGRPSQMSRRSSTTSTKGTTETLWLSGTAELTRDPALLERLAARGKSALLVTRVTVEECFFHCGKAFIRSSLWQPGTWPEGYLVNLGRQLAKRIGGGEDVVEKIEEALVESYTNRLY